VSAASQGGDLREAIWRDIRQGTSEYDWYNKGKDVALAVARGLHFLHHNGVVHRYPQQPRLVLPRVRSWQWYLCWHRTGHQDTREARLPPLRAVRASAPRTLLRPACLLLHVPMKQHW